MINKNEIIKIDKETIRRYDLRFKDYGISPITLGWDTRKHQFIRFKTATTRVDFSSKMILDVGCGFSDFYEFLIKNNINIKKYKGIDINYKLIEVAKKRFPENKYEVRNILLDNYKIKQADIIIMFGLLNFKLKKINNLAFSEKMIKAAWAITKETLIIDFLSSKITKDYPKEDLVYYHKPADVLKISLKLSSNVLMVHDYPPIPQKEFMIIIKR